MSAQLGGDPTAAQQLLVQAAAIKALRFEVLTRIVFQHSNGRQVEDFPDTNLLKWMDGLRKDLVSLGLNNERGYRQMPETVQELLESPRAR